MSEGRTKLIPSAGSACRDCRSCHYELISKDQRHAYCLAYSMGDGEQLDKIRDALTHGECLDWKPKQNSEHRHADL